MAFDGPLIGGRYRLGPKLGKGSQGEIFLARDEKAKGATERRGHRQAPHGRAVSGSRSSCSSVEGKVLSQAPPPRRPAPAPPPSRSRRARSTSVDGPRPRREPARPHARRRLSQLELRDILVRSLEVLDYLHTRHAGGRPPRHQALQHRAAPPTARSRSSTSAASSKRRAIEAAPRSSERSAIWPEQLHGPSDARDRHLCARPPRSSRSPAASSPKTSRARACA